MIKINKNLSIVTGAIALAAIAAVILWYGPKPGADVSNQPSGEQNQPATDEQNQPASNGETEGATTPSGSTGTATSLTYTQALKTYKDRRIQFSLNNLNQCLMNPTSVIYKNGTKVMFDNRIAKQITVYLAGTAYTIKTYGFRILTLSAATSSLPYTIRVDCEAGKNTGKIILER